MIHYEYPLSERIRTLLRLEDLFNRFDAYAASSDPHAHHAALLTLFEMAEVAARADLKTDLLHELERQKSTLTALRGNPHVQDAVLERVLTAIEKAHLGMYQLPGKVGQHLREDDWLMAIKQRAAIPGGMCEFDLPSYHYWLHRPSKERNASVAALARALLIHTRGGRYRAWARCATVVSPNCSMPTTAAISACWNRATRN